MSAITLYSTVGTLTPAQVDANFTNLNTDKLETNFSNLGANAAAARTALGLVIGTNVQAYSAELAAAAGVGAGMVARTGAGAWAARTLIAVGAGLIISNGDGVAAAPSFSLGNDLQAVEALASTGFAVRTGTDTWAQRTLNGTANRLSVVNGGGVSGNAVFDIDAAYVGQASITTVGTIATGTWSATISTADSAFTLTNSTKLAKFSAAAITAGQTRTYTLPDVTDTLVSLTATQTLTNKTLTNPVITGGTVDSPIGNVTPNTGRFTVATLTGTLDLPTTTGATVGAIRSNGSVVLHFYGSNNNFQGLGSGNYTLTGQNNVGLGALTLAALTSGSNNVAVGATGLNANTSGSKNVAVGSVALSSNLTGNENFALGYFALFANTSGSQNVAIGSSTLAANTTASNNVAIGPTALDRNTTGTGNIGIGKDAGTTASPTNANTTGTLNTWIGNQSGPGSTTQFTNSTGIGNGALNLASNEIVFGNASVTLIRGMANNLTDMGTSALPFRSLYAGTSIVLAATAGAVNGLTLASAPTGNPATITAGGAASDATVGLTLASKSTGAVTFNTNGANRWSVDGTGILAGAINNTYDLGTSALTVRSGYFGTSVVVGIATNNGLTLSSQVSGSSALVQASGADTNISVSFRTKGTGAHSFCTNTTEVQAQILATAGATRYLTFTGSNGGNPTIGTSLGALNLSPAGLLSVQIVASATVANYLQITAEVAGNPVRIVTTGTDANVPMNLGTRGTGGFDFRTEGNATTQFKVTSTAAATRWIEVTGSAAGNPAITTSAGSLSLGSGGLARSVLIIGSAAGNPTITTSAGALAIDSNIYGTGSITLWSATAIQAGGVAGFGLMFTNVANFGVFPGSGAPTLAAAKGSLYLRSDGSSTSTRAYINTDGGTTWTAITTAA